MRRSALVNVPSFSRNDEPGKNTCAYFAVSFRNRSCTITHSIAARPAVTCCVFGSDCAGSSPCTYRALKLPSMRRFEHVRDAQARLRIDGHAPLRAEQAARDIIRDMPVAGELVRERAHVARALHVVLAAQRIHAHAFAADVAGGHREIRDAHHHRAALAVLGDAEAVVDRAIAAGGEQARRTAHVPRRHAGDRLHRFGRVLLQRDEILPALERARLAAFGDELPRRSSPSVTTHARAN